MRTNKLEKELDNIETGNSININMNRKREIEKELDALYENEAKGVQIRSNAKWIANSEKNTIFFYHWKKHTNGN